jgi:hypothetical protein
MNYSILDEYGWIDFEIPYRTLRWFENDANSRSLLLKRGSGQNGSHVYWKQKVITTKKRS